MLINLFNTVRSSGVPCTLRELLDLLGALENRLAYANLDDFYHFCDFCDVFSVLGAGRHSRDFQRVPGGRGSVLTKYQPKRTHLDPIHHMFDDFSSKNNDFLVSCSFFGCFQAPQVGPGPLTLVNSH